MQMMEEKNIEKEKIIFITEKKSKRITASEFLPPLQNCALLTLFIITNFFKTWIGLLM